ncbi:MAG: C45 family peptidase, partial [Planctomycetota bacterium]
MAVWGDQTPDGACVMGRNAEYISMGLGEVGSLLIVRHATDQTPMVLVGFVGMLGGFTGITADGVAFGNLVIFNAAPADDELRPDGLPVQLAMPLAADAVRSAADMIDRLLAMKHAIPMNVMAADRADALIVELGPERNVLRQGRDGVLSGSNYYVDHPDRWFSYDCPRQVAMEEFA